MSEALLQVRSLSKIFSNLLVLDGISFDLRAGEVVGVVGRRGAGKTTLLNILGGVFPPNSGHILVNGRKVHFERVHQARRVGVELVNQFPPMVDQLSVLENIFLGRELCVPPRIGMPQWRRMHQRASELLTAFSVPLDLLSQPTGSLTDEQRHMVALARSLCHPAKLLILDDFLPNLSFQRQTLVLEHIKKLAQGGTAVIICSDNLKHLFSVTDRILVLYEGRLSADRLTQESTARDIVELIVGMRDRDLVTPVIWALESYHSAQRKTEELFRQQERLHRNLEQSDSLNRQLVEKLSEQVRALGKLNLALQSTQRRLMTEREEERKALARELHDQSIQDLLSINYRLEEAGDDDIPNEHRQELIAIREGIRQVVGDLRQLCRDLRPPTIDNHGLPSAIRSLTQEWSERTGIMVHLEVEEEFGRLPEAIELSVFRIVQEGINNIAKHARATRARVTLKRSLGDSLLVRIEDDGKVVTDLPNLADLSASKHYGLLGISERAALMGGAMKFEAPQDGGFILTVEIPSPYPMG
ncbi:MAG: ATP-binding cassette domain-containing protein [Anaerolineae bacterium]|nr:ATP-binding cassette domain-containing protein [Anaerolineae bacterium]